MHDWDANINSEVNISDQIRNIYLIQSNQVQLQ